ncbi:putative NAD-P-binding protein [Lyophyllum shimeji]|uniref:NAD-P-binding protein n=1 Tax=Lyophyllum shimeji TaxID=47721 RepID=A0A9P3UPB5_LYOSH|nr:putative NAD-P-binding protein [Lyophyllum shimeji]
MPTANAKTNILITGGTGYIGGSVLSRFLDRPDFGHLNITALVRSPEKAEKVKTLGISVVVGSHKDDELVEKLAAEADVVIAMADADDLDAANAILRGLEKRYHRNDGDGKRPILIHTSGTGVLADDARGMYASTKIYDDLNPDDIDSLPPTQLHRPVDMAVIDADKKGYVRTYIVAPSTIYGFAKSRLVDIGVQNPYSIQIPVLVDASLDRRQGGMVGEGKNLWPNVSNSDVADLFHVVYDNARNNPGMGHGSEGFFFGENGEHSLYQLGKAIAENLVVIGRGVSPEPTPFTKEELDKYFQGSTYMGSNARCRANHSRLAGWKPKNTKADMFAGIPDEIAVGMAGKRGPAKMH